MTTARELADHLGITLDGDPSVCLSALASPESASPADLIYVDSPRQLERASASKARCALLPPGLSLPGKTLLLSPRPKLDFARAASLLVPALPIAAGIHPTAVIAPSANLGGGAGVGPYAVIEDNVSIGEASQIGPFCFLGRGSQLGSHCRLYPRVTLYAGARLGNRVIIHAGSVIGSDGFGYVAGQGQHWKFPQLGSIEIADDVEIGANSTLDRGSLETTCLDSGVKLDNLVHVAHNVRIGANTLVAAQTGISGSSIIGKDVVIAGQVGIADHCTLEDGSVAGAQAGIPTGKTIRAGQVVWGTPARPLDKFKEAYAWFARLPELASRLRNLESRLGL